MDGTGEEIKEENAAHNIGNQRIIRHSFTDDDVHEMSLSCVPVAVQTRIILNSVGFRFEDDGKPSLVINHNPKPVGVIRCWRDEEKLTTNYEQIIATE